MSRSLIGLLLLVAAEGAAIACSCVPPPRNPVQARQLAHSLARGAIAVADVELVTPYDAASGRGERLRVRRMMAGRSIATFEVERQGAPSSASCDLEFQPGRRTLILLFPPERRRRSGIARYRISSLCTNLLLANPTVRATVVALVRRGR